MPWTCSPKTPGSEKLLARCPQPSSKPPSGDISHQPSPTPPTPRPEPLIKKNAALGFTHVHMLPDAGRLGNMGQDRIAVLLSGTDIIAPDKPSSHKSTCRGRGICRFRVPCHRSTSAHTDRCSAENRNGGMPSVGLITYCALMCVECGSGCWGHSLWFSFERKSSRPRQSSESAVGTRARVSCE